MPLKKLYRSCGYNGTSLEGVRYLIKDGVLYVSGNILEFTRLSESISEWGGDKFSVTQEFLNAHEVDVNCIIRNYRKRCWLFFHKKIPIVIDVSFNEYGRYFMQKKRLEFNMCVSSFKIVE